MTHKTAGEKTALQSVGGNVFDEIYATDLRYWQDCWKLCGDAHCCSFSRYKARFQLIARTSFQELPLLPGEYEYLASKGWLSQFGDFDHKVFEFPLNPGRMRVESIISRRPHCACDHDTRPTICRLYPLLPVYDIDGALIGTDSLGVYEDLEALQGLEPACRLTSLPFSELQKFLKIASAIGRSALALFYIMAYRLTKEHVRARLMDAHRRGSGVDIFALFERKLLRGQLIDEDALASELRSLADSFQLRYGERFRLE